MLLESLLLLNTPTWFKTFLEDQALPALGALRINVVPGLCRIV